MPDFQFRALELPGDAPAALELLALGFPETVGHVENTPEFLSWKFAAQADVATTEVGFVREDDGAERLVSFYGAIPIEYLVGGRRRTLGLVCDVMSHPEIRRQGLFVKAGQSAMKRLEETTEIAAVLGYPIRDDVMPGHLRVGWSPHFRLPIYVATTGRRVPGSTLAGVGGALGSVLPRALGVGSRHSAVTFPSLDEFAASPVVAQLGAEAVATGVNFAPRSESFVRWRLSRPGATYVQAVATSPGGAAYAIARETTLREIPALAVLDVMSSDHAATRAVMRAMWSRARESGAAVVAVCANRGTARRLALGRLGFVRSPLTFTLIARSTSSELDATIFDADASWHLTWLDADTV